MKKNLTVRGMAVAACIPAFAGAQAPAPQAPTATAPLAYRSAFADYKPYQDTPLANWRHVNDTVAGASGGASGHASRSMGGMKGMDAPPMPASSASAPVPMTSHRGMPMHGGQHPHGGTP